MPYIKSSDRSKFDISDLEPNLPGELNYVISELCAAYLSRKGMSYTHCNEIIGALECVKLEFYRRLTAPYEDQKITENGDISYENLSE